MCHLPLHLWWRHLQTLLFMRAAAVSANPRTGEKRARSMSMMLEKGSSALSTSVAMKKHVLDLKCTHQDPDPSLGRISPATIRGRGFGQRLSNTSRWRTHATTASGGQGGREMVVMGAAPRAVLSHLSHPLLPLPLACAWRRRRRLRQ